MKKEIIEKYKYEESEYHICKANLIDRVEYQVFKDDIPVSIKITASYQNIADYKNSGLPDLTRSEEHTSELQSH